MESWPIVALPYNFEGRGKKRQVRIGRRANRAFKVLRYRVPKELPSTEPEVIGAPILKTAAAPRRCKTDYNRHVEKSVRFGLVQRASMAED
ncbi:hypothetical protein L3X38_035087 [Prunus dulcis]|uniref:Uncharacterized protein n=1 Tax=Prunus dulcis TaxID=3755 RepID=A0AAD4VJ86_PRUDU|nr:hypothetical protein L3X38_035087 [Prunus dulcis]